jgi:hypothetical protein
VIITCYEKLSAYSAVRLTGENSQTNNTFEAKNIIDFRENNSTDSKANPKDIYYHSIGGCTILNSDPMKEHKRILLQISKMLLDRLGLPKLDLLAKPLPLESEDPLMDLDEYL